jgi:hypothetical protein
MNRLGYPQEIKGFGIANLKQDFEYPDQAIVV